MAEQAGHRFRRRLTAAFVMVAAVSAGIVAVITFVLAGEYRWRNFRNASVREARVAAAVAPQDLNNETFNRLRAAYERRSHADLVAVEDRAVFSSSPDLDLSDLPAAVAAVEGDQDGLGEPTTARADVDGQSSLVVAMKGSTGARYYFIFSLEQLHDSLRELGRVAAAGWIVTVVMAAAVGHSVARQTLRPLAAAASAAEAIAAGDLDTRLSAASRDEFGALANSFNHMADELQELITQLHESAIREQRFTADVAHELRTPLTGMSAAASVLAEQLDGLPHFVRRPAAVLVADVRRLRDLVLELLELSRLDRETAPVLPQPLHVADAVSAVVSSADLRRRAEIEIDVEADAIVLAEPQPLRRILANLNDEERIFDRFFKSDASRAASGSGLGLSIARKYALAQNGDLLLERTSEQGACFTLRLPAATGVVRT